MNRFSFKSILLLLALLSLPVFIWLFFSSDSMQWRRAEGKHVLKAGKDYHRENDGKKISQVPDSEMLSSFETLKEGFTSLDFSLASPQVFAAETISKNVSKDTDKKTETNTYSLDDVEITTHYNETNVKTLDGFTPIKQTITLKNRASTERIIDFTNRIRIAADEVVWDDQSYLITDTPQTFKAYDKTSSVPEFVKDAGAKNIEGVDAFKNYTYTYKMGSSLRFRVEDGKDQKGEEGENDTKEKWALYDWTDALLYNPEISVYHAKEGNFIEISIKNISVPGNGQTVIDPNFGLNDSSAYDIRYDGSAPLTALTDTDVAVGDVNGDGKKDLVIGASGADYNGIDSGSAFVIFGGTGIATGNKPFDVATNYNIRYDGGAASDYLTYGGALTIGDVNGDSLGDLILGTYTANNNGLISGSAWVMFSTLIDDVGATTGNTKPLSTAGNYNIRYDGVEGDQLTFDGAIVTGDLNGDSLSDLVLGALYADNNGNNSGSAWVMFSTLIDDVGATTGNTKLLSTAGNYNVRYAGGVAGDQMTRDGIIRIGDVNGDSLGDLVLGSPYADNSSSGSGSAWVMFSTLIDDVGATTGNTKPLSTAGNYNIRYDGGAADDNLVLDGAIAIGDLNSDSLNDLVLGAYNADNNGSTSGSAWVMFSTLIDDVGATTGNTKPLSTAGNYNIRYDGGAASDQLTKDGVIAIGDLNSDSSGDLVLGARFADNNGSNSGSAWVMFSTLIDDVGATTGNTKPLSTAGNYNIRYDGGAAFDRLMESNTLAIGDVNGDSLGDLVLGADGANNNGDLSGSVWVMFSTLIDDVGATTGNTKPLSTSGNYNIRYDGSAADDNLALDGAIAVGDLNDDSLSDLILGSSYADSNGPNTGSAWTMFSTLIDDVGATTGNAKPFSTGGNYSIRYDGSAPITLLTDSGVAVGDVNGDGKKDLVIAASGADYNGADSGSAFVIFGGTGIATGNKPFDVATNYNIRYDGGAASDYLTYGGALAIGDVNGDSLGDLVLGSPYADNNGSGSGSAWVMFSTLIDDVGATTGNTKPLSTSGNYNIRYDGGAADDWLTEYGALVIGDLNGDSLNDLVLGADGADNNGAASGSAWVMFSTLIDDVGTTTGNTKPLSTSGNYNIRYDGGAASDYLTYGGALAIGDVNGDSLGDLTLGALYADNNGATSGSAWVMFSTLIDDVGTTTGNTKPLSTSGNYNIRYDGGAADDGLTYDGALAIGDINGDSLGDLVLGTLYADNNGATSGSAWVMFSTLIDDVGTTTGNTKPLSTSGNYNIRYDGGAASDYLTYGGALAIGDVNGDSLNDLVLGAYGADNNGATSGSAWVMFSTLIDDVGATTGNNNPLSTSGNYNIRYDGGAADDGLTYAGALAIGDVNGDSKGDLVLGTYYADNNGAASGSAWVMFSTLIDDVGATTGNNNPLSTSGNYNIRYDGGAVGDALTYGGVLTIGDVNDDSLGDLIFGASYAYNNGLDSGSVWVVFGGSGITSNPPEFYLKGTFDLTGPAWFE